jgi:hypothetical protein
MVIRSKFLERLCHADVEVNGILVDINDFGTKADTSPEAAPTWGCGCMTFQGKPVGGAVLQKYGITAVEYGDIVAMLTEGLSFGRCERCS